MFLAWLLACAPGSVSVPYGIDPFGEVAAAFWMAPIVIDAYTLTEGGLEGPERVYLSHRIDLYGDPRTCAEHQRELAAAFAMSAALLAAEDPCAAVPELMHARADALEGLPQVPHHLHLLFCDDGDCGAPPAPGDTFATSTAGDLTYSEELMVSDGLRGTADTWDADACAFGGGGAYGREWSFDPLKVTLTAVEERRVAGHFRGGVQESGEPLGEVTGTFDAEACPTPESEVVVSFSPDGILF